MGLLAILAVTGCSEDDGAADTSVGTDTTVADSGANDATVGTDDTAADDTGTDDTSADDTGTGDTSADDIGPDDTDTTVGPEPVAVCELAYYTGEFTGFGDFLTAGVVFPVEEVINLDPPLGRTWELYHEDLGTVGEGQAARTCLEQHGAEIMVSIAHGYQGYRDFMIDWWAENDAPLGPSVHGGGIPGNLGGKGSEPIFRAQGLDEALAAIGVIYAEQADAETIVIFASLGEFFQPAAATAVATAEAIDITVLARIDAPPGQESYQSEVEQIAELAPDAIIVVAGLGQSATVIKDAAEAGLSAHWIGDAGWSEPDFIDLLGTAPIASQQSIGAIGFGYEDSTAAWDFFRSLWNDTPGYRDSYGPAANVYHYSAYDVLVQTALAVEYGGSYRASDWAPAMFAVGDPPGTVCYTYADCLAEIRDGSDIDYEGITGPGTYTSGGVNAVRYAFVPFREDGSPGESTIIDPARALEVIDEINFDATCDADNTCTW